VSSRAPLAALVAAGTLIALGYLAALGRDTLSPDELDHLFAARSMSSGRGPQLPSGQLYSRGVEYSALVRTAVRLVQPVELAVRLPSALLGIVAVMLFAGLAWRWVGPWAAVWATLFFGAAPLIVEMSRFGRFYTMQLALGLVAMGAGWRVVAAPGLATPWWHRWIWCLVAALALTWAAAIQLTTVAVAAAFGLCLAVQGAADLARDRRNAWRTSTPLQAAALGLAATVIVLVANPGLAGYLRWRADAMPLWARLSGATSGYGFLLTALWENGVACVLAAGGFVLLLRRAPRQGVFLILWLAIPVSAQALVLAWKADRFVLLALPPLFLAAGEMAALLVSAAAGRATASPARRGRVARLAAAAALCGASVAAAALNPDLAQRWTIIWRGKGDGWREARAILDSSPALRAVPIGHAMPLGALHYLGRVDFVVWLGLTEEWVPTRDGAGHAAFRPVPEGGPDVYAGVPVLVSPASIRRRFLGRGGVVIGVNERFLTWHGVDRRLIGELAAHATELCHGRCGTMRLYYWPFQREVPAPTP